MKNKISEWLKEKEMELLQWLRDRSEERIISNMRKHYDKNFPHQIGPYERHTNFQLMEAIDPGIMDRIDNLQTENPELLKEIDRRQGPWGRGFAPFSAFQPGAFH